MITVEKILFLRNVSLFSSMPTRELGRIAAIADEVVYPEKTEIIREGEFGESLFIIVEGQVRIFRGEVQLNVIGPRSYFGEMSILDGEPRSASASALTDCLLLRIKQADFHEILSANFDAVMAIVRLLCGHLRTTEANKYGRSGANDSEKEKTS